MSTTPPSLRSVGEFIRTQRELMSLSMRKLAEMAKVSNPYLSQIERGVYTPSAQVLKGIADALDISVETLFKHAGFLDDQVERPGLSVEDAIRMDPRLTKEGKQALIQIHRGLVGTPDAAPSRQASERPRPVRTATKAAAVPRSRPTKAATPRSKATTAAAPRRPTPPRREEGGG